MVLLVNGQKITGPQIIRPSDKIGIGDFIVELSRIPKGVEPPTELALDKPDFGHDLKVGALKQASPRPSHSNIYPSASRSMASKISNWDDDNDFASPPGSFKVGAPLFEVGSPLADAQLNQSASEDKFSVRSMQAKVARSSNIEEAPRKKSSLQRPAAYVSPAPSISFDSDILQPRPELRRPQTGYIPAEMHSRPTRLIGVNILLLLGIAIAMGILFNGLINLNVDVKSNAATTSAGDSK